MVSHARQVQGFVLDFMGVLDLDTRATALPRAGSKDQLRVGGHVGGHVGIHYHKIAV